LTNNEYCMNYRVRTLTRDPENDHEHLFGYLNNYFTSELIKIVVCYSCSQ